MLENIEKKLDYLIKLIENKNINYRNTQKYTIKENETIINEVRLFVKNNCIIDHNKYIITREFLDRSKLGQKICSSVLQKMGIRKLRPWINGKQIRCYYGIGWKDNK